MKMVILLMLVAVGAINATALEIASDDDWTYVRESEIMTKMHQSLQNINVNLVKLAKVIEGKADENKKLDSEVTENKLQFLEYRVAAAEEEIRSLKKLADATQQMRMRQRTVTTETEMVNSGFSFASGFSSSNQTSKQIQNETNCPTKFVDMAGRCYFFSNYIIQEWIEAWKHCQDLDPNAILVSFESEEEWNAIESYLRANNLHTKNWWTGGSDGLTGAKWMWMGSNAPFNFTNWASGEPNGGNDENCLHIYAEKDLGWNDVACSPVSKQILFNFICELQ